MTVESSWRDTGFDLSAEVALVTGGCGRLGPAWVDALLRAGATVHALDLPNAPVPPALRALESSFGSRLNLVSGDVTNRASLEKVLGETDTVSVLVNNAGVDQPPSLDAEGSSIETASLDPWRRVLEVNLLGAFQTAQVFGGAMASRGRGSIVNIGSLYASHSPDNRYYDHLDVDPPFMKPPAYGASKAALINLTRYLSTIWAGRGVRVNALSPGGVLGNQDEAFKSKFTARVPLGRMAEPDDLIGPLIFLASDASRYVTGIDLLVDGGYSAW